MNSAKHHRPFMHILLFAGVILVVLMGILTWKPAFTAQILVAEGGEIANIDIVVNDQTTHWVGVYGVLVTDEGASNMTQSGGQVLELNLTYTAPTTTTIIAAATGEVDWSSIAPASHAELDSFLGLASSEETSATNTFSQKTNFTLDGSIYEVWSAQTQAQSGAYITGALISQGNLVFVTSYVPGGIGFSGSAADYQLLLPINSSSSTTYSFTVFENDSLPGLGVLVCNMTFDLTAEVADDNISIILDWNDIPGVESYDVLYLDGPSNGYLNFSNSMNISRGTNSFWIDSDNSSQRAYRVRAWGRTNSCLSNETAGTLVLELSPDYNLISTPFTHTHSEVSEVLKTSRYYDSLFEYGNEQKEYKYYIKIGQIVVSNFNTIESGAGYWLRVSANDRLRLAGTVNSSLINEFSPDYNLFGSPIISNDEANENISYVLNSIDDSYDSLFRFNNDVKAYSYYIKIGQIVVSDFSTIEPGKGYWLRVTENANVSYDND